MEGAVARSITSQSRQHACSAVAIVFSFLLALLLQPHAVSGAASGTVLYGETRKRGNTAVQFDDPMGLALMPDGTLLVADTANHRIQACRGPARSVCHTVAGGHGPGLGPTQLRGPYSVVTTSDGRMIIADTLNHRIQLWNVGASRGITMIGGSKVLNSPAGLALDEGAGYLFVADTGKHIVSRFNINVTSGKVVGDGTIVAGQVGNFSSLKTHLDNPMGIFWENTTGSIWIADARNKRIVRWNETGREGVVEVSNLTGRPYGLYLVAGTLYYADFHDCVVWKRHGNRTVAVAGQPSNYKVGPLAGCGSGPTQLSGPAGFLVSNEGVVTIADSINYRVVRWYANPSPTSGSCQYTQSCSIPTRDANPTAGNLLVVVRKSADSRCGGVCYPSSLSGPAWSNTSRPNPPLVRNVTFDLGIATLGDLGDYRLCWGAAADAGMFASATISGRYDCSSVPFELGVLTMTFYIDQDLDGSRTECVKGTECWVFIKGFGLPLGLVILTPPTTDFTGRCGESGQENFLGYRESVSLNPASYGLTGTWWQPFNQPNQTVNYTRNLTTIVNMTFGEVFGIGKIPLCLCGVAKECTMPYAFNHAAGFLRLRSTVGGQSWFCLLDTQCTIKVRGTYLRNTDVGMVMRHVDVCKIRPSTNESLAFTHGYPRVVSKVDVPAPAGGQDMVEVSLDLGIAKKDRRFRICYCASYDVDDIKLDQGDTICDSLTEYSMSAGIVGVIHTHYKDYECPITKLCIINISGVKFDPGLTRVTTDGRTLFDHGDEALLISMGTTDSVCGKTIPLEGAAFAAGNVYRILIGGNDTNLQFNFSIFMVPGIRALCFCSSYDAPNSVMGACNDGEEFYQPIGLMVVRGPQHEAINCIAERPCIAKVLGTELSVDDRLQVCSDFSLCGSPTPCPQVSPEAVHGVIGPNSTSSTGLDSVFKVGTLALGLYALCYCATGRNNTEFPLNCSAPSDLVMSAGNLRVRGPNKDHRFSCVAGNPCTFTVTGFDLSPTDHLLIAPLDGHCGNTSAVNDGTFFPSPILRATQGTAALVYRHYNFDYTAKSGRYRVCYCVETICDNDEKFYLSAGKLFVKGLTFNETYYCQLGDSCTIPVTGFGLNENNDTIQILPKNRSCSGLQSIVEGDMNATGVLNGTYVKQPGLIDGRSWYKSEFDQYLFYDVYAARWIMGPKLNPDIPEEPGWAYASGRWAKTPEEQLAGPWHTWDPLKLSTSPTGAVYVGDWTPDYNLAVVSSRVKQGIFSIQPSRQTTDRVRDEFLGAPYLLAERFQLGTASYIGPYKICYCPSIDKSDYNDATCSGDDEYIAEVNLLIVNVVRGGERYHCAEGNDCFVRTVLSSSFPAGAHFAAILLPVGSICFLAEESLLWNNSWKISGGIAAGVLSFNLGPPPDSAQGEYTVCICTNYDNGFDGVPCGELSEFFQEIGTLTIAPLVRLDFEYGSAEVIYNLTRGSGLNESDRVRFVLGDDCSLASSTLSSVGRPQEMGGDIWAAYVLGTNAGGVQLNYGMYSACLCADWDGTDAGEDGCNSADEFLARVGLVFVNVIRNPVLMSSVDSFMIVHVAKLVEATNATPIFTPFQGGRRLAISNTQGLERDIAFATACSGALVGAIASTLRISAEKLTVVVTDVVKLTSKQSQTAAGDPIEVSDFRVNFTASLQGSESAQHLTPVCVSNGWKLDGFKQPVPLNCFLLSYAFNNSAAMIGNISTRLDAANLPGISAISVTSVEVKASIEAKDPNFHQVCARGMPCFILALSNGELTGNDKILVAPAIDVGSADYCGPTVAWPGQMLASLRGIDGLTANPVAAPGKMSTVTAAEMTFAAGPIDNVGTYNLCYCWSDGSNPDSTCTYNWEFFQGMGQLAIRGPVVSERIPCITHANCVTLVEGVELSAWDRVLMIPASGTCGSTPAVKTGFENNPGVATVDPFLEAYASKRSFEFGVAIVVGEFRICYCVWIIRTGSQTQPCQAASDYAATAGLVRIRGVRDGALQYSCAKVDQGIAPFTIVAPCTLGVTGYGILPEIDSIFISPLSGNPCNGLAPNAVVDSIITGTSSGVSPNPMRLVAAGPLETWAYENKSVMEDRQYADKANFSLNFAEVYGTYRICSCTAGPDPAARCSGDDDFFNQIGTVKVRGVSAGHLFICEDGLRCSVSLSGLHLSTNDRVEVVGPADVCGWPEAERAEVVEVNPAPPVEVINDGTRAIFPLGAIARDVRGLPVTLRICYCASYDGNGDQNTCNNITEYTHTAGFINTVICPEPPKDKRFIPPVEDIFGDPGQPRVSFYTVPAFSCTDSEDSNRGYSGRQRLGIKVSLDGPSHSNYSVIVSSMVGRCDPGLAGNEARMNKVLGTVVSISLVAPNGEHRDSGSNLQVSLGYGLRGQAHVIDQHYNKYYCPSWQVQVVPYACTEAASILFGCLLHAVLILSATIMLLQNKIFAIARWLRFLKAMRPPPAANPEIDHTNKHHENKEVQKNKLHSVTKYLEWELEAKTETRTGELKGDADRKLVMILRSRLMALFLAFLRIAAVVTHVVLMSIGMSDIVYLLMVPGISAIVVLLGQLVLMTVARGCGGLKKGLPFQPLVHSMAAVLKVHFDLVFPMLARKHHCEVWRVATIACVGVTVVQVVIPVVTFLLSILPPRRQVPDTLIPYALSMLGPIPEPRPEQPDGEKPPEVHIRTSIPLPSAIEHWAASADFEFSPETTTRTVHSTYSERVRAEQDMLSRNASDGAGPRVSVSSNDDDDKRRLSDVGLNQFKRLNSEKPPRQTALERERPSPITITPVDHHVVRRHRLLDMKNACVSSCATLCAFFRRCCKTFYWDYRVIMSKRIRADPEETSRSRLIASYVFLEASGWYAANALIRETIEVIGGVCLQRLEARWSMLSVLCGGLDLTAIQAFFLFGYMDRLSSLEVAVVSIAAVIGVIFCGRPGIVAAFVDFFSEFIHGGWSLMSVMLMVWVIRFLASCPLARGCPFFTWAFSGWCISILVLEVPILLIWIRRQHALARKRQQQTKPKPVYGKKKSYMPGFLTPKPKGYDGSSSPKKSPSSKSMGNVSLTTDDEVSQPAMLTPLGRFPSKKFPGFGPDILDIPIVEETDEKPILGEALPDRLDFVNGCSMTKAQLLGWIEGPPMIQGPRINLDRRLVDLHNAEEVLKLVDYEVLRNATCREQVEELQAVTQTAIRRVQLAVRSVQMMQSKHFRVGSLYNQARLLQSALPEAPLLRYVHWNTIAQLERLPACYESDYLLPALDVWKRFEEKAVVVSVIHRWRSHSEPDPMGHTARQLVTFALWYRQRYGANLEIFFWIDYSCLPQIKPRPSHPPSLPLTDSRQGSKLSAVQRTSQSAALVAEEESQQDDMAAKPSAERFLHLTDHLNECDKEMEIEKWNEGISGRQGMRMGSLLQGGPTIVEGYDESNVTHESSDAFLPLVFACSDVVVLCEARDSELRAWVQLELAMAYAIAPSGDRMYAVDHKLGIKRKTRPLSVPPATPATIPGSRAQTPIHRTPSRTTSKATTVHGDDIVSLPLELSIGVSDPNIHITPFAETSTLTPFAETGTLTPKGGMDGFALHRARTLHSMQSSHIKQEIGDIGEEDWVPTPSMSSHFVLGQDSRGMMHSIPSVSFASGEDSQTANEITSEISTKVSTIAEPSMLRACQEALERTKPKMEVRKLHNPVSWEKRDVGLESDKDRIVNLLHVCLDEPMFKTTGGFRRPRIEFGSEGRESPNIIHMVRLEAAPRPRNSRSKSLYEDPSTLANIEMMKNMGIPESNAREMLQVPEDEDEDEEEEESTALVPRDIPELPNMMTSTPGAKNIRLDRNERIASESSTRVFAHVRKRFDWEEKTMDLYYHHRWQKKEADALPGRPKTSPAQILIDKATASELATNATPPHSPKSEGSTIIPGTVFHEDDQGNGAKMDNEAPHFPSANAPVLEITRQRLAFKTRPFGMSKEVPRQESAAETLLRRAANGKASGGSQVSRDKKPLTFYSLERKPTEERFHPDFHPNTILLGDNGLTAMQLRANNPTGGISFNGQPVTKRGTKDGPLPCGGMAVTMHSLPTRRGVAPEEPQVRGVCFEVVVETVDSCWGDGIGIGFTAQDPDRWNTKKPQPRHASCLGMTWMCGYSGRWVLNGRSEMIRPLRGGHIKSWQPGTLQAGDIVTAVVAPAPADIFRILVNGQVVAERCLSGTGMQDPEQIPLWGAVDVDGACVSVRLRTGIAFGANPATSTRGRSEPRTLLGSTVPLGLRVNMPPAATLGTSERRRPATSDSPVRRPSSRSNRALTPSTVPVQSGRPSGGQRPGSSPARSQ